MSVISGWFVRIAAAIFCSEHGLADLRLRDDEAALALADGREEVEDAPGDLRRRRFEAQPLGREVGRQVLERRPLLHLLGRLPGDGADVGEGEEALVLARRAHVGLDGVAEAEGVGLDLLGGDEDVVGRGQVVVLGAAEEAVAGLADLEHAGADDQRQRLEGAGVEVGGVAGEAVVEGAAALVVAGALLGRHRVEIAAARKLARELALGLQEVRRGVGAAFELPALLHPQHRTLALDARVRAAALPVATAARTVAAVLAWLTARPVRTLRTVGAGAVGARTLVAARAVGALRTVGAGAVGALSVRTGALVAVFAGRGSGVRRGCRGAAVVALVVTVAAPSSASAAALLLVSVLAIRIGVGSRGIGRARVGFAGAGFARAAARRRLALGAVGGEVACARGGESEGDGDGFVATREPGGAVVGAVRGPAVPVGAPGAVVAPIAVATAFVAVKRAEVDALDAAAALATPGRGLVARIAVRAVTCVASRAVVGRAGVWLVVARLGVGAARRRVGGAGAGFLGGAVGFHLGLCAARPLGRRRGVGIDDREGEAVGGGRVGVGRSDRRVGGFRFLRGARRLRRGRFGSVAACRGGAFGVDFGLAAAVSALDRRRFDGHGVRVGGGGGARAAGWGGLALGAGFEDDVDEILAREIGRVDAGLAGLGVERVVGQLLKIADLHPGRTGRASRPAEGGAADGLERGLGAETGREATLERAAAARPKSLRATAVKRHPHIHGSPPGRAGAPARSAGLFRFNSGCSRPALSLRAQRGNLVVQGAVEPDCHIATSLCSSN